MPDFHKPTMIKANGINLGVFEARRARLPANPQAVRTGLAMVELPGRFQIVPGQPTLVLDVAHNPQSVAGLAPNLGQMGFYPATHAVFGAMRARGRGIDHARRDTVCGGAGALPWPRRLAGHPPGRPPRRTLVVPNPGRPPPCADPIGHSAGGMALADSP